MELPLSQISHLLSWRAREEEDEEEEDDDYV